jgi:hypothetical protein
MAKSTKVGDDLVKYHTMTIVEDTDFATAGRGIKDAIEAIAKQAKALKDAKFKIKTVKARCPNSKCRTEFSINTGIDADVLSKTFAYTAKSVDELARLMSFLGGGPDSRQEVTGVVGIFQMLTDEQIEVVDKWVEEGKKRLEDLQ